MQQNFETAFEKVVGHEGGFGDDPRDRGNWTSGKCGVGKLRGTKYGVSAMAYPHLDIKNLTLQQAKDIYRSDYWDAVSGDALPSGVDYMAFDGAVNQGVGRTVRLLQAAAGVVADGKIGPKSLAAFTKSDPVDLLTEFSARRMNAYMLLDKLDDIYGLGWSRRLMAVFATAIRMA